VPRPWRTFTALWQQVRHRFQRFHRAFGASRQIEDDRLGSYSSRTARQYGRRRVLQSLAAHLFSKMPGTIRSATAWVASGVLSRGPIPVPPVVKRTSTRPESAMARNCSRIFAGSSDTHNDEVTSQPSPRQNATTAGPDRSSALALGYGVADGKDCDAALGRFLRETHGVPTVSRLASSISRIASINRPVVLRVVVVFVEAFAAFKINFQILPPSTTQLYKRRRPLPPNRS